MKRDQCDADRSCCAHCPPSIPSSSNFDKAQCRHGDAMQSLQRLYMEIHGSVSLRDFCKICKARDFGQSWRQQILCTAKFWIPPPRQIEPCINWQHPSINGKLSYCGNTLPNADKSMNDCSSTPLPGEAISWTYRCSSRSGFSNEPNRSIRWTESSTTRAWLLRTCAGQMGGFAAGSRWLMICYVMIWFFRNWSIWLCSLPSRRSANVAQQSPDVQWLCRGTKPGEAKQAWLSN